MTTLTTAMETRPAMPDWPVPLTVDRRAAEQAATVFLTALGISLDTGATGGTAARMATAFADLLTPREFVPTTFLNEEGHHDLVLARSVPFTSLCAHHMLPFVGIAHVGYLPGERILGLSKVARLVQMFAARPQVQEDLTQQLANWLDQQLGAGGVGVVLTAEHMCMTLRGAQAHGATTVTATWRGELFSDRAARAEFLALSESGRALR